MAAALSLCSSLTPKLPYNQTPFPFSHSRTNLSFLSHSLSSLTLASRKQAALSFTVKLTDTEGAVSVSEPETESPDPENEPEIEPSVETTEAKREEIFAVVMVGGRQYIVFPGRYIYTQRLKGASVNDKVTLNKVLLVGTKTSAYIGKPIVPNATVEAIVEEQTLDKKVIVFKYKRKKNYRRNIGHRQDGRIDYGEFATMMRKGNPDPEAGSRTIRGNLKFNLADAPQGKSSSQEE